MKSFNNEIQVHRNETFTFDKYIVGNDGAPYIVSKQWSNPYLLFTIASTRYEQKDRYKVNYWLDLDKGYDVNGELVTLPRFQSTKPYLIEEFGEELPEGFEPDTCVFYTEDNDGNRDYRYWDPNANGENNGAYVPYEFRVVKHFTQLETREWVEQNYVYSVQLVSGDTVEEYLYTLYTDEILAELSEEEVTDENREELQEEYIPKNQLDMYDTLYEIDPELVEGINRDGVLINYSSVQFIIPPTKLSVASDINGGL